jgi:hypothetical protein
MEKESFIMSLLWMYQNHVNSIISYLHENTTKEEVGMEKRKLHNKLIISFIIRDVLITY